MRESGGYAVPGTSGVVGPVCGAGGYVTVTGFSLAETAGTATVVELRDQASSSGTILAVASLKTSSDSPLLPDVKFNGGVYVTLSGGGTVVGSIFFR